MQFALQAFETDHFQFENSGFLRDSNQVDRVGTVLKSHMPASDLAVLICTRVFCMRSLRAAAAEWRQPVPTPGGGAIKARRS